MVASLGLEGLSVSDRPLTSDARLLAADLFEQHADAVVAWLARRFPGVDAALVHDGFVQALLDIARHPQRHEARRGSLRALLCGAARRVLIARLRAEQRRRRREDKKSADDVTRSAAAARSPLEEIAGREEAARAGAALARTEEERRILDLWLQGEADLAVHARALGIGDWPAAAQEKHLRRIHNRLRQRLHRYREHLLREGDER
jgi:DNA-directed RNA polymerase specialized sigma24 family protein